MKQKSISLMLILLIIITSTVISSTELVERANSSNEIIISNTEEDNQAEGYKYISYQVKADDSLYRIALQHGVSVDSIMELNNLSSYMIYPGQKLIISVVDQSEGIIYTVKAGDSLYRISLKYDVSISDIKAANNLSSNMIYIGQKLEIPDSSDINDGDRADDNSGDQSNKGDVNSYKPISGTVNLNNKTWGSGISRQESELENNVSPLYEGESAVSYQEQEVIVKYKPMINSQSVEEFENENSLVSISSVDRNDAKVVKYQIPADQDVEQLISEYNQKENVAWAEPNYIYYPTAIPQEQYYNSYQWNMVNMNMEAAWDVSTGDSSVVVAVLDTGIIPDHPDLKGNLLQGADMIGGIKSFPIESYNISDFDPTDESTYQQGGSHGTHVSGIIGALSNNKLGVAGINWNVKILPIRGLTKNGGTSWDIAEGIYYAIDQGADIINMSFGGNHSSYYQHEAVKEAVAAGVTVIAATGNEGSSSVYYPAAYPETIAVGAVGKQNIKTAYSNYGPEVDIVAPGGDYGESIISTWGYYKDGKTVSEYNGMIGTSMAAPHVSGVAALLVASGIKDPEEIRDRLINNTRELGDPGKDDYYGYGLVDAYGALVNKKIMNPVVFTATRSGSTLHVKSDMIKATDNGSFKLSKVNTDSDVIISWFDGNDNGMIDGGDYYGEVDYSTSLTNPEINLSYLSSGDGFPSYQVVK
ncbi:MAG: S8 family serine peptidase [Halanaerobiales bacterium]